MTQLAVRERSVAAVPIAPRRGTSTRLGLVVALVTIVALLLRLQRLRFGFAHQIVDYDDGVYFGASLSLVDGRLPYRDFAFVQPPLVTLLMAPIAVLAKAIGSAAALAVTSVLTALAGAASVALAARLVWHRGPVIVLLAASLLALQGDAVAAGSLLLLEPWAVLLCLTAAVVIFRGDELRADRLAVGGVILGLACATKIWAVVPLLAVALVCLPDARRLLRLITGALAGFVVPVLPFVVAAPGRFVHDVLIVQLTRVADVRTEGTFRLLHLFGAAQPDGQLPGTARGWLVVAALVIVAGSVLVIVRTVGSARPLERFAVLSAVLVIAMLLVPGACYWHYAAFAVPFVALAVTLPLSRLDRRTARAWTAVLTAAVAGLAVAIGHRVAFDTGAPDEAGVFAAAVPAGSCVVATMPTATIADDRYATDAACPQPVDPFGEALVHTGGRQPSAAAPRSPSLARVWLHALHRADFVYVDRRETRVLPADASVRGYLHRQFRVVEQAGLTGTLYQRVSSPPR